MGSRKFKEFSGLSPKLIEIPRNVYSIDGSAFFAVTVRNISIDSGNQRFVYDNEHLIDLVDQKLIGNFSTCKSLSFAPDSRVKWIDGPAFSNTRSAAIPSTILFLGYAVEFLNYQFSLSDPKSCPAFDRWRRLIKSAIAVDFQRIRRFGSDLPPLEDFALDLAAFEEGPVIGRGERGSTQICRRRIDSALAVVKPVSLYARIELCEVVTEIENLLNLRHPAIAPLVGFVFPVESNGRWEELKTARLHASGSSLADVLRNPPAWWTPTAKAKAIAGIALVLRFAHGLGLLHGVVKAANVFFDAARGVQLADFSPIRLETGAVDPFSGEKWAPTADVCGFASLVFDIVVGVPVIPPIGAAGGPPIPATVPDFVARIIEEGRAPGCAKPLSFFDILESLKENGFQIVAGVDSEEVSGFVRWMESAAESGKWE
jgi:hypothetical protein